MPKESKGVRLDHISKIYTDPKTGKDFYAVHDVSLDIAPGSFVTLLGPSGCGKTTTLRMVAGFESPDEGEIYLGGQPINELTPNKRDTAMVFQSYALFPHYNVFDNVAYGLKLRKVPKAESEQRVRTILDLVEMGGMESRMTNQLSGGQQQRVALARALVVEPGVLLFDEPLSNLDAKLRVAMRTEITKLHQRLQTTFIYVTHDQTEAMTMASRIVVMKDGFVQQVDTPQNLYDYPANLFVAGFIGSPQMNFFTVKLVKEGNDVAAVFGDNKIIIPPSKLAKFADEDYIGKEVYMGIRPENIHDEDVFIQAAPNAVVDCNVEVTELMGSETYLYLSTSGKEENIIARVNPRTTSRAGQKVQIAFDVNHLHFFDKETETTLLTR